MTVSQELDVIRAEMRRLEKELARIEYEIANWNKEILLIQQTLSKNIDSHEGWQLCEDGLAMLRERIVSARERMRALSGKKDEDE